MLKASVTANGGEQQQQQAVAAAADKPSANGAAGAVVANGSSGEGEAPRRPRFATLGKDPSVRTDFLPDKDREREEGEWARAGTVQGV